MKYKFPQFNVEIVDPTDVLLSTDTAQFGVIAQDMPYVDTWEDSDIPAMVDNWLIQFEA